MLLIAWSLILQPPCLMKVVGPSFFALSEASLPSAELSFLSFSVQEVVAVSTTAVSSSLGAVPNSSSGAKDVCCRIDYFILSN